MATIGNINQTIHSDMHRLSMAKGSEMVQYQWCDGQGNCDGL